MPGIDHGKEEAGHPASERQAHIALTVRKCLYWCMAAIGAMQLLAAVHYTFLSDGNGAPANSQDNAIQFMLLGSGTILATLFFAMFDTDYRPLAEDDLKRIEKMAGDDETVKTVVASWLQDGYTLRERDLSTIRNLAVARNRARIIERLKQAS